MIPYVWQGHADPIISPKWPHPPLSHQCHLTGCCCHHVPCALPSLRRPSCLPVSSRSMQRDNCTVSFTVSHVLWSHSSPESRPCRPIELTDAYGTEVLLLSRDATVVAKAFPDRFKCFSRALMRGLALLHCVNALQPLIKSRHRHRATT